MNRSVYRDGVLLSGDAVTLTCSKTLGATGELDLWPSSGAMVIPAGGELSIVSSNAQDAALIADVWTIEGAAGSDFAATITINDVAYSCFPLGPGEELTGLDAALASGSKEAWGVIIDTVPNVGDVITIGIGATNYALTITDETTPDDVADGLTALIAGIDPVYDTVSVPSAGAVALTAKVANVNTAAVTVTLSDSGDATATQIVTHGPPCTTHTAVAGETLVITANTAGVAHVIVAATDNLSTPVHTQTGGVGTGLKSLKVSYLTATGDRVSEVLTMAGTTPVSTSVSHSVVGFLGAESLSGTAVGTVTIKREATTIASITAGDSETHNIYVATGDAPSEAFTVTGLQVSNGSGTIATIRIRSTGPTGSKLLWQGCAGLATNNTWSFVDAPLVIGPESTLKVTCEGNGAQIWASLTGFNGRA